MALRAVTAKCVRHQLYLRGTFHHDEYVLDQLGKELWRRPHQIVDLMSFDRDLGGTHDDQISGRPLEEPVLREDRLRPLAYLVSQ